MKVCTKCGIEKELSEFYKSPDCLLGVLPQCKTCKNKQSLKYQKLNKSKINKQRKKWYKSNSNKIKDIKQKWRESNKTKVNEYFNKYAENLADHYVKGSITKFMKGAITHSDIPQWAIDLKRIQIKIYRELYK